MESSNRVLFVEYGGSNGDAIREALETQGFRVACAADSQEAMKELEQWPVPELILLDGSSATDPADRFLQEVKQARQRGRLPIVLLCSPQNSPCLEADARLVKPVDFEEMIATLRQCFHQVCAPARRRILIVDDNRDGADSLKVLLSLCGFESCVAYDGPDGLELAHGWQPDIILSDIGLPGLDGYALARKLRSHPRTAGLRLIAITAYGTEADRQRAWQAGFNEYLVKPPDLGQLLSLLVR